MSLGFRSRLFLSAWAVGIVSALLTAGLLAWSMRRDMHERIEDRLLLEAQLVGDVLVREDPHGVASLDAEADRLGAVVGARVTFIAADGTLAGDSELTPQQLPLAQNHAHRPEVVEAARSGFGRARRHSVTVHQEMIYVAVPVRHPVVRFVRLALPETDVQQQLHAIVPPALLAIGVSLAAGLLLAWAFSAAVSRRMRALATAARHYAAGDFTRPALEYGDDEIGAVARTLDAVVADLGTRLRELAASRARTEAILAGMVEGVVVVDEAGRIQLLNGAARRLLDINDDATGRPYVEIVRHPDVVGQVAAALRGGETQAVELTLGPHNRVLLARGTRSAADGRAGAVLVLHDITELRQAGQVRRDFVANVSHELRTPLTAIRGYAEALLDETDSPQAQEFLQVIFRNTSRMERLVGDLLRLARLDARQETLETRPVDLAGLFEAVEAELKPLIDSRGTRLRTDVRREMPTLVSDTAKLHDVLRNLLENAITYTPEAGSVSVTVRPEDGSLVLEVADTGPGIPPADLDRVFERFYRVEKSRARNPGGTGLGLAIVRHLVALLGGTVQAANRAEGGAVFTVRIPLGSPRSDAPDTPDVPGYRPPAATTNS